MNPLNIIENYYEKDSDLYNILVRHSTDVTNKAVSIAAAHPELKIDIQFVEEAAMLHDIGIFLTDAPSIKCFGTAPYLCHGYLGHDLLNELGYSKHALVCERHTGTGLSLDEIVNSNLPLPHRDMRPVSIEEQLICFADCFFSKTHIGKEKSIEKVRHNMSKFDEDSVKQFDRWCAIFL